ncbi:transmembrane protein 71 isoform X3 [Mesocricetus auratus]|uniref:Transmembrane protein 71 isoform X3 n=1 Tax=Mesocricetus auratus TaxID=10036 RepID=A0ABM2WDH1_MESAU|nr:transmembrane protein 71 isoform X3 [Mesocricetus auratus]
MYRASQLTSTPVANSSRSHRGHSGELSPTCIFPSFGCDFLDGEVSFECCSIDPLTGSHYVCRRSPRLLTNGYYIWTEDSFLCDPDGHITLNPSHTSVMYKENLVRIFRKKKRTPRSLSSLLDLRASKSWLHGSIFGDADSPPSEDIWLEGIRSLEAGLMLKASFQAILLAVCLIISACARWFMGGELASIFTCALMITIAYIMKPLFLSLAGYFKATTCAKFDSP